MVNKSFAQAQEELERDIEEFSWNIPFMRDENRIILKEKVEARLSQLKEDKIIAREMMKEIIYKLENKRKIVNSENISDILTNWINADTLKQKIEEAFG